MSVFDRVMKLQRIDAELVSPRVSVLATLATMIQAEERQYELNRQLGTPPYSPAYSRQIIELLNVARQAVQAHKEF